LAVEEKKGTFIFNLIEGNFTKNCLINNLILLILNS